PAARPQPYLKSDKYRFLGMYGETPDMSGGFGQEGVEAFEKFFEAGGTLITALASVRFPIEFGWARSIDTENVTGLNAQKPLVQAEIVKTNSPIFYGYGSTTIPLKYGEGAEALRNRAFAMDVPEAFRGKGRVIMFSGNPIYRWQNHGEFNMVFNAILNWNDTGAK